MLKIIRTITYCCHCGLFVFTSIIVITNKFITLLSKNNKKIIASLYMLTLVWLNEGCYKGSRYKKFETIAREEDQGLET
jgi:hypothetical protein